ncbi:MAG: 3-dehydroquinate synthase family protein, partial [Candidatus Acidiferrales bacterium]
YRRFLHGEAIGWGMIAATLLSVTRNRMTEAAAARILRLIASIGPLPPLDGIRAAGLRRIMAGDKKARGGRVRWVLAPKIGSAQWGAEIPWPVVAETFAALPAIFARAQKS